MGKLSDVSRGGGEGSFNWIIGTYLQGNIKNRVIGRFFSLTNNTYYYATT